MIKKNYKGRCERRTIDKAEGVCRFYSKIQSVYADKLGRPLLVACVDAYSGLCCGYSLLWEGGIYSVREMMLNVIADKVKWCKQFGIQIEKHQWPCDKLPGVLVTDRGSEYISYNFEQISEIGCQVISLPSFSANMKGPVEKLFDLVQDSSTSYVNW